VCRRENDASRATTRTRSGNDARIADPLRRPGLRLRLALAPAGADRGGDGNQGRGSRSVGGGGIDLVTVQGDQDKSFILESTGSGAAAADFDGDGDEDIYVATAQTTEEWRAGRRPRANALYRNNGDGTFTDVAEPAGVALRAWSSGAYFVDYDADGDKDLFVTTWGPNALYRNDGDGTFTDVTEGAGVAGAADGWSTSAAFGDLDGDSDLDLFVANYCDYDLIDPPFGGKKVVWKGIVVYLGPLGLTAQADLLYRNNGDGTFTDVSKESGVTDLPRQFYALGVVMADFDRDGRLDVYVANDSRPNLLWHNDGGLRFSDISAQAGVATNEDAKEQAGMGTDAADFDGDGQLDLVVTNFSHDWNTMYRNRGSMFFLDDTFKAGFRGSYMKLVWGVKFFDYDNDGWLDVMTVNGHVYPQVDDAPHLNTTFHQPNSLYRNNGDATFEERNESAGPGLAIEESSRGLVVLDYDRDGALDVLVTNMDAAPNLLHNEGNENAWIALELKANGANRDAIGAWVELTTGDRTQVRQVNPFGSYQSQSTYRQHFGLGDRERVDHVLIRWTSGASEELTDLDARRFYTVTEGRGVTAAAEPAAP
jgi:hypothetical protein